MSYTKSQAQSGKGSVFSIGIGATPTYTIVGEVTSVALSGNSAETVVVSNFQSGSYQEYIPTIINSGSIKLSGNRVSSDAGQVLVQSTFASLAVVTWKLVLPLTAAQTTSGDTYVFGGLIESSDFTVDVSKQVNFDVTIKVSGAIVLTVGT